VRFPIHFLYQVWRYRASIPRWSEILVENGNFYTPLHSIPPLELGSFQSEYCHDVWHGKTRIM